MSIWTDFALTLSKPAVLRLMGYKEISAVSEFVQELVVECMQLASDTVSPKVLYKETSFSQVSSGEIRLSSGHVLKSEWLARKLQGCEGLGCTVVSLGEEFDQLILEYGETDPFKSFVLSTIGSYQVQLVSEMFWDSLASNLASQGRVLTSYCSPGSKDFLLSEQASIFGFLHPEEIGVFLTDSFLMRPSKSSSAVFGIGRSIPFESTKSHDCAECDLVDCLFREEGARQDAL